MVRRGDLGLRRAEHANIQRPNAGAQRVAVEAQELGGADLVAPCRGQRRRQQRQLDLPDDAVVETGRRQILAEACEVSGKVAFDLLGKILRLAPAEVARLRG